METYEKSKNKSYQAFIDEHQRIGEYYLAYDTTCKYGPTYLMKKVLLNDLKTVEKMLKEDNSEINAHADNMWTALHVACANSKTWCSEEMVLLLLKYGADKHIGAKSIDIRYTSFVIAARYSDSTSTLKTFEILLDHGAPNNIQSLFEYVIKTRKTEIYSILRSRGFIDPFNEYILYYSSFNLLHNRFRIIYNEKQIEVMKTEISDLKDIIKNLTNRLVNLEYAPPPNGGTIYNIASNDYHALLNPEKEETDKEDDIEQVQKKQKKE